MPDMPHAKWWGLVSTATTKIDLKGGLSTEGVRSALFRMTSLFRKNFPELIHEKQYLHFEFLQDDGAAIDESHFFDSIVEVNLPVGSELAVLIRSYLAYVENKDYLLNGRMVEQLWCGDESGAPALGYAMKALLLIDPRAFDVFRSFIEKRDSEHEGYCREDIWTTYLNRFGYSDIEVLQLGVFLTIDTFIGGYGYSWNEHGLLTAARNTLPPYRFADMIAGEMHRVTNKIENRFEFLSGPDDYVEQSIGYLMVGLSRTDEYSVSLGRRLITLFPTLAQDPYGLGFFREPMG